MTTRTHDDHDEEGVEVIHADDGSITARNKETGVALFGYTNAETFPGSTTFPPLDTAAGSLSSDTITGDQCNGRPRRYHR